MEGVAKDATQKITNLGQYGMRPIGFLEVVNKTPEEIEASTPKPIPHEKQSANITNEQLQNVLNRLSKLEAEA